MLLLMLGGALFQTVTVDGSDGVVYEVVGGKQLFTDNLKKSNI